MVFADGDRSGASLSFRRVAEGDVAAGHVGHREDEYLSAAAGDGGALESVVDDAFEVISAAHRFWARPDLPQLQQQRTGGYLFGEYRYHGEVDREARH